MDKIHGMNLIAAKDHFCYNIFFNEGIDEQHIHIDHGKDVIQIGNVYFPMTFFSAVAFCNEQQTKDIKQSLSILDS